MADPAPAARSIRLIRSPARDGVGVFHIRAGPLSCFYTFHEIPCEIGGRGFAVHRLGVGTLYHVRVGRRDRRPGLPVLHLRACASGSPRSARG